MVSKSAPLSQDEIFRLASAQKLLLWAILGVIFINGALIAVFPVLTAMAQQGDIDREILLIVLIASRIIAVALLVVQVVAVWRLCLALKEGWATIIYVFLQCVPCISLIFLLFLNSRATSRLQGAGIRVGLMGAKTADVANYSPSVTAQCSHCGEPLDEKATDCPLCGAPVSIR